MALFSFPKSLSGMPSSLQTPYQGSRESEPAMEKAADLRDEDPDNPLLAIAAALDLSLRAVENGGKGAAEADAAIEEAFALAPDHPLLVSLKGLVAGLDALHSWNPVTKVSRAKECKAILDDAVGRFPRFYASHVMRGQAFLMMPDILFDTRTTAIEDLEWIVDSRDDRNIYINEKSYTDSLMYLAALRMDEDEREEGLRMAREALGLSLGTPDEEFIRGLLKEWGEPSAKPILPERRVLPLPEKMQKAQQRQEKRLKENPSDKAARKELGILSFYTGLGGHLTGAERAIELLDGLEPDDPVVLTYLGAAWVLSADSRHYSGDSFARVAVGLHYLRQADALGTDNYVLNMIQSGIYSGAPVDLFLTREAATRKYQWLLEADPPIEKLKADIHAIYGDADWHVDSHYYYMLAIREGFRFHEETKLPFVTSQVLAPLAQAGDRLRVMDLLVGIVKDFPGEVPDELAAARTGP